MEVEMEAKAAVAMETGGTETEAQTEMAARFVALLSRLRGALTVLLVTGGEKTAEVVEGLLLRIVGAAVYCGSSGSASDDDDVSGSLGSSPSEVTGASPGEMVLKEVVDMWVGDALTTVDGIIAARFIFLVVRAAAIDGASQLIYESHPVLYL